MIICLYNIQIIIIMIISIIIDKTNKNNKYIYKFEMTIILNKKIY